MVRIAGINIPDNKRVIISLSYIYGIGPKKADEVCKAVGIVSSRRVKDLADSELSSIQDFISNNFLVEGDLRRKHYNDIRRLIDIRCYRGIRHRNRMPVHGQRTRCNASTARKRSIF